MFVTHNLLLTHRIKAWLNFVCSQFPFGPFGKSGRETASYPAETLCTNMGKLRFVLDFIKIIFY